MHLYILKRFYYSANVDSFAAASTAYDFQENLPDTSFFLYFRTNF